MRFPLPDRGERGERGAIAIMTAFLTVVVLAMAALAVDISTQVNERQKLHDTIDAAAHAGAYRLPSSGTLANRDAVDSAKFNDPYFMDPTVTPSVDFFCVVASKLVGGIWAVDTNQTPSTCYLLASKVTNVYPAPPARCNSKICSIPCNPAVGDMCNTLRVIGEKPVPFSFAPAISSISSGSTGSVSSAACKGSCGTIPINPMDIAVVADRTTSMLNSGSIPALVAGIEGMLTKMTPSQQYVALGTIGRSKSNPGSPSCTGSAKAWSEIGTETGGGPWIPVQFSNNYLVTGTQTLNTSDVTGTRSNLVQAVKCLKNNSSSGTYLASPMKAAARYLLGPPYNSTTTYPAGAPARPGTIRKAIIFETDGAPQESNMSGSALLSDSADIGSTNGTTACTNLSSVASQAKTLGILVVTVAFDISTAKCNGSSGPKIADVLAAASSPTTSGANNLGNFNNYDCSSSPGRISENSDTDNFFCAAPAEDLAPIFVTAFTQLAKGIRLIQLP